MRRADARLHPGAQTMAATVVDERGRTVSLVCYGGGVGSGKSHWGIYEGGKLTRLPHAKALRMIGFRAKKTDLKKGGGLWDRATQVLPRFGGAARETAYEFEFEAADGRIEHRHRFEFAHLTDAIVASYDGTEFDLVLFDELQQFSAKAFFGLFARLRSSASGVQPRCRATCNPRSQHWLRDFLSWWIGPDGYVILERSGVVRWFVRDDGTDAILWFDTEEQALAAGHKKPQSATFVLGRLEDNPSLGADFEAKVAMLPRVERMRLRGEIDPATGKSRGGNWDTDDSAGGYLDASKLVYADEPPSEPIMTIRFWDTAASVVTAEKPEPDYTEGVRVSLCANSEIWIDDLSSVRAGPEGVLELVCGVVAFDGIDTWVGTWQDTGGAGKTAAELFRSAVQTECPGTMVSIVDSFGAVGDDLDNAKKSGSSAAKRSFALAWVPLLHKRKIYVKRATWNARMHRQINRFPNDRFDDIVDAISGAIQVLSTLGGGILAAVRKARVRTLDSSGREEKTK